MNAPMNAPTQVLLVEDEAAHAELIRRAFAVLPQRYHLRIVSTLQAARDYLAATTPDIVLVDYLLPDGRGTELLPTNGETTSYPVVILTSNGNEQIAVEALKSGALDYVVKSNAMLAAMPAITRRVLREWGYLADRRKAQADLRRNEEQFRRMLEAASEGILLVDQAGQVTLVNRQFEQIFGYDRHEILGQPIEVLLPEANRAIHINERNQYMQNPQARPMGHGRELRGRRKDGAIFPVEVSLAPVEIEGAMQIMCFVIDITARQQLEEQRVYAQTLEIQLQKEREIVELKQRFMSMISHDFRTPLAVMGMACEIIQKHYHRLSPDKIQERIRALDAQVRQMAAMLDEVSLLNKSHANRLECEPEPLAILNFCRMIIDNILLADDNKHQFILELDETLGVIQADKRLLEHILMNLLSNAVKYSPVGTTVTFTMRRDGPDVLFHIQDEGMGIPKADQPRIFEEFYRAGNARNFKGSGLGLAIVKSSVLAHNGTITLDSAEGRGTTFEVRLPINQPG
ncbi:MAG: PAS domain S-box protein [Anaerolineae bacterium]|nr:PAS domain S-box protein [Anaerolineae bacterium]